MGMVGAKTKRFPQGSAEDLGRVEGVATAGAEGQVSQAMDGCGEHGQLVEEAIQRVAERPIEHLADIVCTEEGEVHLGALVAEDSLVRVEEDAQVGVLATHGSVEIPCEGRLVVEFGCGEGDQLVAEGNLSPRPIIGHGDLTAPAVMQLNIDQSAALERDPKQVKLKGRRGILPSDRQLRSASTASSNSLQHISLILSHLWLPCALCFSFVHAKCTLEERKELWQALVLEKPSSQPWCICGDFNAIIAPDEKKGGRPFSSTEGLELMSFMEEAEVFDVGFSGSSFTWCNNRQGRARIWKRLDRLLINGECSDLPASVAVFHLARHPFDHAPLKISFASRLDNKPHPFRFLNVWTSNASLLDVIRTACQRECQGSPMKILCTKLLSTRRAIQEWNKHTFGNIFDASREAETDMRRAEARLEIEGSDDAQVKLHWSQARLNNALSVEEHYWEQKRRTQGVIHRIKDANGVWLESDEDIANKAVRYFSDIFSEPASNAQDLLQVIPTCVPAEESARLEADPTMEKVKRVILAMDGESAAGPDGFTSRFFSFAWEVIGPDVFNAILSFFCGVVIPRFFTSTSIILIPKGPNPQDFSKFRLISLCTFFNKVLSKILADRLASLLPCLVSPQQTSFVKGRNITENYLLAQELVSGIRKASRGGNVALKLDMSKAYDRVSWLFLINVLRRFGFGERFIDMVWRLISNVWFSIIINGASYGLFQSRRGLTQGDPLSLALFVLGADVLSRALNNLVAQVGFLGFKVPLGCPPVTHLAFADDVLIFTNGSARALRNIIRVLELYQRSSGQQVNGQKSGYVVHPFTPIARRRTIERITGFPQQQSPIRYLGFPLHLGRSKASDFGEVSQAVLGRILSGKSKLLSQGGKLVLIKYVLSSIPLHLLSATVLPVSVFSMIEKVCSNFLWGSNEGGPRYHWIRWDRLCFPTEEGGVGFRQLRDVYTAFSLKLWWKFRTGDSLWAKFLLAKYCRHSHPCQVEYNARASAIWKRLTYVSRHAELSMRWLVNSGTCDFWYDTWLGSEALFHRVPIHETLTFKDFLVDGRWSSLLLARHFPTDIMDLILQQPPPVGERPDELVWMSSASEQFSLSYAFQEIRQRLPLDDVLGRFGVQLPSKCFCCRSATGESIKHIFASGQLAREVWGYFGAVCGIGSPQGRDVVLAVSSEVNRWNLLPPLDQFFDRLSEPPVPLQCKIVRWRATGTGIATLNTDGCSKCNLGASGGGGVLRDSEGRFLIGFSVCLGVSTSLRAEVLALLAGLRLCLPSERFHTGSSTIRLVGVGRYIATPVSVSVADSKRGQEVEFFTLKIYHGGVYVKEPVEKYVGGSMESFEGVIAMRVNRAIVSDFCYYLGYPANVTMMQANGETEVYVVSEFHIRLIDGKCESAVASSSCNAVEIGEDDDFFVDITFEDVDVADLEEIPVHVEKMKELEKKKQETCQTVEVEEVE
ncbi:uncharacterized protein LOC113770609 [Coffea eugenioides]|uniref:uncharacterized protein LOC113770609 n=1 Tax=Coffea eugenioides TaxID=49369 RepID=UPI000F60A092|nr:uncharacterized protein LOC113770609 [Coffea eugenioides]